MAFAARVSHYISDDELHLLRGTSLHAVTVQWKSQVNNDFSELQEKELCESAGTGNTSTVRDALEGYLTKERYLWALATVRFVFCSPATFFH